MSTGYIPKTPTIFDLSGEAYNPASPLFFDFNSAKQNKPLITLTAGISYRNAKAQSQRARGIRFADTRSLDQRYQRGRWTVAATHDLSKRTGWKPVAIKDVQSQIAWGQAIAQDIQQLADWKQLRDVDLTQQLAWHRRLRCIDIKLHVLYNPKPRDIDQDASAEWLRVDDFGKRPNPAQILRDSLYLPNTLPLAFNFAGRRYSPLQNGEAFFDFRYIPPEPKLQPVDGRSERIRWGEAKQINPPTRIRWKWATPTDPHFTGIKYPDYDGPVIIIPDPESAGEPEIKETYVIANTVSMCVLPDCTPINATGIVITRDIDSYSWMLSANIFGRESMQLLKPDQKGQKNVKITINGHEWIFVISSYSSHNKFPSEHFTVQGASRTQLLGEPYARTFSAVNAVDINALQAVEDLLQNTGFTVVWDSVNQNPPDWTISAGALTYQEQTPIEVAGRIAEAIGAVIRPHATKDEFAIIPRYRDPVWQWHDAFHERIIPHQIISEVGGEWSPKPEYNSCYVSGTTHGVAVDVRRAGTAGNQPAPDVFDELITATAAARARGIAEICKGGNQEIVNLTLPLFPVEAPPALIHPAMLCEVRPHNEANWRGLCLETTITAEGTGASVVKQQVKLERHHGNR